MSHANPGLRRERPFVPDEVLADQAAALRIPVLVAGVVARRVLAEIEKVAVGRRAVRADEPRCAPAVVVGAAGGRPHIGPGEPMVAAVERERPGIFATEF